jgi:hydrophobe/amphiphile efflux-1 (HAE1) family protein
MNLPKLAIDRPVFLTCVVFLIMILGLMAYSSLGVDLYPDTSFPFVSITTGYKGAGPQEIETQISKPIEDQMSTLEGVKKVFSTNEEGYSQVLIQFTLETDSKEAEQRVRDRMAYVRPQLPKDIDEPVIGRFDLSDMPVAVLSLQSSLTPAQAYDLADQVLKPMLSQVEGVGVVDLTGGAKREIRVELDRAKLNLYQVSASQVAQNIGLNGMNVPVGKFDVNGTDLLFRSVGEYNDLDRLRHTVVDFVGSDVPITVDQVGKVVDTVEDPQTYSFLSGKPALFLNVHKQSKANTVAVVDGVKKAMTRINDLLKTRPGSPRLSMVQDTAWIIRLNLHDVVHTIWLGILLTVLVVLLFLGSFRSTLVTVTALPVSLLGAFILMNAEGFTLNVMSLLALSLAVGLLVDDAIVVRENIWRHMEEGADPRKAAVEGALEVALAVVATTSVILAVFLPIAFLKGIVGQFFRQFGMTVCFAMAVSLFEAMTMGPMLSAYWAAKGKTEKAGPLGFGAGLFRPVTALLEKFGAFQDALENHYERLIGWCLENRLKVLGLATLIFLGSLAVGALFVKATFQPNSDVGEFELQLKAPPGTSLDAMKDQALKIDALVRAHREVDLTDLTVGDTQGNDNTASIYVKLVPSQKRAITTADLEEALRKELAPYRESLQPQMGQVGPGGGQAPFNLDLVGEDYSVLAPLSEKVMDQLKAVPGLVDVETNYDQGKPEFQAVLDPVKLRELGVLGTQAGDELRTEVEGATPAKFHQNGLEYDIRVRMQEDQRDLEKDFDRIYVPNTNHRLVRLSQVADPVTTLGPSKITRENRERYIQITGQVGAHGAMGEINQKVRKIMAGMDFPPGVHYEFWGQAQDFQDLVVNMIKAMGLAILFTYMILASLYESPILPFTIMAAIPLAIVGALIALAATHTTLDIFSMIALIMLMGLVTKNAILLVDYTLQLERKGMPREEALKRAGKVRLRPILMTTFTLVAGMLPVALALTEVGKYRQSMGVAVIGGLLSSLFLTLIVVPSLFGYVDDFRLWLRRLFHADGGKEAGQRRAKG